MDSETSPEDEASRASNSGAGASSSGNCSVVGGNGGPSRADGPSSADGPGRADVPGRPDGPLRIEGALRPDGPIRVDGSMRVDIRAFANDPPLDDAPVRAEGSGAGPSDGADAANDERAGLGPPPHPPCLARSLQALSTPRPPDNLAAGIVEQLPSEGMSLIEVLIL